MDNWGRKMAKKEYRSRKDLNIRETLAYEYMLDGLSLKRIAKSTGYQWKPSNALKACGLMKQGIQDWINFNYENYL